jgi:hypothetical protein
MICPNVNLIEWKNLVKEVGEDKAYISWNNEDSTLSDLKISKDLPLKSDIQILNDKIKILVQKKLSILENKNITNKQSKKSELNKLSELLSDLDGIDTINAFIEDSYTKSVEAQKLLDNIINNSDSYTKHQMINNLATFNEFANGYNILDEISKSDIKELQDNKIRGIKEYGDFGIKNKLLYAIDAREELKSQYIKLGIPLLADFLLESKSTKLSEKSINEISQLEDKIKILEKSKLIPKAKEKRIKEINDRINKLQGFDLTKIKMIEMLKTASSDEGVIDFLFSPLISSEDSVLSLFAKSVKSKLEDARQEDIKFNEIANEEYNKFLEINKKNKDNVEEFNSDLYEEIELPIGKDDAGNTSYQKRKALVQKYDITSFEKNKEKFFKELGPKPVITVDEDGNVSKDLRDWNKKVSQWFRDNTQPKSDIEIKKIRADKKNELLNGIITQKEFEEWEASVIYFNGTKTYYRGELTEPASKYINKKWENMYSKEGIPKDNIGRYHKFLVDTYLSSQEKLPNNFRRGYVLPSIPKTDLERALSNGFKNTLVTNIKDATIKRSYDTEYGLTTLSGEDAKFLPVFYTQNIDIDDVSVDLLSSIAKFNSMVNKYNALDNIIGEINLTKNIVANRETIETNSKSQQVIDAFASKHGYLDYIKKDGQSYSKQHIDAFIDMIVYGEMQKSEEIFGLDSGKLTNTLTGYSAITTIAADILKGVANNLQGNIQVLIESNSGEYFNKKNLRKGKAYYYKSIPSFLSDFESFVPKSLPSQLIEKYDAIQGTFKNEYGEDISGSMARKLFKTSTLFFNQNLAEHEIQVSTLFAVLDANTVVDNETKQNITLLEAYQKYGIDGVEKNTDFTDEKRKEIQNNLHAIAKRLHGVYNDFDKGTAQRYSLGRLAIMYRKHLIPGYKRRFKSLSGDQELGGITEGYYRTFWNTFVRDLRDMQFNITKNWENYTDFEKAQIKRTTAEAALILTISSIVIVLKGLRDDDDDLKKNYVFNFMLYQASRMRSETSAYISPIDAYRVVKSPSAMTSTLDRTIRFTDQFFLTWDSGKLNYKRKIGVWDKGSNKSWAYFLKLMGYSGYNITPEEAVKSFEGSLAK